MELVLAFQDTHRLGFVRAQTNDTISFVLFFVNKYQIFSFPDVERNKSLFRHIREISAKMTNTARTINKLLSDVVGEW